VAGPLLDPEEIDPMSKLRLRRLRHHLWRRGAEWPLITFSLLYLGVYAWQVIGNLKGEAWMISEVIIWALWIPFVIDYAMNLILSENRGRWFRHHFHEFLILCLPMLRPLRLLRLVTLLNVLQRAAGQGLRGRVAWYAGGCSVLLVVLSSLAMLDVEQNASGATILNFGDALWWASATISTVGYGDVSPVTIGGRLIAAAMMIAGIAVLGTVTAMLGSWLLSRVTEEEREERDETQAALGLLTAEVAALREALSQPPATGPPPHRP
jgi:voltage-gated potassium channel